MNLFSKRTLRNLGLSVLSAAALSACGGAGSCTNCSATPITPTGTPSFSITAPTQYPAGVAVTAYLTMTNKSSVNATGLTYSVPAANAAGNNTGVAIAIDPNGAGNNCTSIAAGASCTFTASIPAGSHPGSFTVTATSGGNTGNSAKLQTASLNTASSSTAKSLQASISVTANLGLVNLPTTNNQFYILPSDQVVPESSTTATTVYVSVLVQSGVSAFDTLKLVDDAGVAISGATLVGTLNTAANSVNTYKVVYPAGSSGTKHIQAYSYTGSTPVCNTLNIGTNNNSACSNDADVTLTSNAAGILSIQPNYFNVSPTYTSQVVTFSNIGNGNISGLTLPTIAAPFSISANGCTTDTLAAGASCSITLTYTPGSTSGQATPVITYNNGTSVVNTGVTIPYTAASSGGGDTPPVVVPTATLTASPTSLTLSKSSPQQSITIENTGTAEATDLALPTIVAPFVLVSNDCGSTLASKASCTYVVKIDYTQAVTAGNGTLAFGYNNGQSPQTTNVAADWAAYTPTPANLVITPYTTADFGDVQRNNIDVSTRVFKVENTGDIIATGLDFITSDDYDSYITIPPPFGTPKPLCNIAPGANSSLAGGSYCNFVVQFGAFPTASPLGPRPVDLKVSYYSNSGSTQLEAKKAMTGNVVAVPAAGALSTGPISGATGSCLFSVTGLPQFTSSTSVSATDITGDGCSGAVTCVNDGSGNVSCTINASPGNLICSTTLSSPGYSDVTSTYNLISCR